MSYYNDFSFIFVEFELFLRKFGGFGWREQRLTAFLVFFAIIFVKNLRFFTQ